MLHTFGLVCNRYVTRFYGSKYGYSGSLLHSYILFLKVNKYIKYIYIYIYGGLPVGM